MKGNRTERQGTEKKEERGEQSAANEGMEKYSKRNVSTPWHFPVLAGGPAAIGADVTAGNTHPHSMRPLIRLFKSESIMESTKSKRGGAREGAGRRKDGLPRRSPKAQLPPTVAREVAAVALPALDLEGMRTDAVRAALEPRIVEVADRLLRIINDPGTPTDQVLVAVNVYFDRLRGRPVSVTVTHSNAPGVPARPSLIFSPFATKQEPPSQIARVEVSDVADVAAEAIR